MFFKLTMIGLAGAAGTLARYGLGGLAQRVLGEAFPYGTFIVNMVGSFLFGLVWMAATERNLMSPEWRMIILTGFMGAFTTYSTFMFESAQFLEEGRWGMFALYAGGQLVLGLLLLLLGFSAGKML